DPAVIEAQGTVRSAGAGVRTARGQYLPSLAGSASGGSSFSDGPARTDPITGEVLPGGIRSQSVTAGLSSDLELFAGFRRGADVRTARGREAAAEAALREALAQSGLRTSNDFFNALAGRDLVIVRREGVRRAEEQLAIAVTKLVTRAATVADSLRAVVQLGEARLALASEEARLAAAEASLARRLGLPGRVAAMSDSTLRVPGPAPDTAAILREAVESAPVVIQAEASIRAAEAAITAARANYWPRLMLSGNYAFSGSDRNDYAMFNNRSVNLGLSWPFFNRFQREQQVVQRQAERDAALARAADARRAVEASLAGQFAALDAARQRIDLARLSVEAARADVRVALERYRLGSIGIVDLNASQAGLTRAEENEVSARFEYLRAKAEIEAILGRPM
ncbi:MAG TPA: TolC family protein, partial [Gemmatimonadales bacterium]|nr:TolC family protein [Gemmatimonadales bacterium]